MKGSGVPGESITQLMERLVVFLNTERSGGRPSSIVRSSVIVKGEGIWYGKVLGWSLDRAVVD